uniref:Rab-GAP TBC domain-containing protein n=1 Tax=Spongospora subterranea TaxID=70186 RepID=A0A0H5QSD6_9EUKA|eukprot:CRZ04587.1 hypothetical protein [Spongospora subterranea]
MNWRSYLSRPYKKTTDDIADTISNVVTDDSEVLVASSQQSQRYQDRVAAFTDCLTTPIVPMRLFRALSFDGIPDKKGLRSTCWKILLGYLPPDSAEWMDCLQQQRSHYQKFLSDFVVNPFSQQPLSAVPHQLSVEPTPELGSSADHCVDNPLYHNGTPGTWSKFFDDNTLRDEIAKDVQRTHAAMHFFTQKVDYRGLFPTPSSNENGQEKQSETHHQILSRILFVYAQLNPGVRYVQGMNELLAPLYYVFAQDPDPMHRAHCEADAFFCFTAIMAELKDRFIASLDSSDSGLSSCIDEFRDIFRRADPELYFHLESNHVDARYYSLRWLTLLCSQEFHLPDVLRLWDSLLSDPYRFDFLAYFCCSMLMSGNFYVFLCRCALCV